LLAQITEIFAIATFRNTAKIQKQDFSGVKKCLSNCEQAKQERIKLDQI
jgi:hypothetical protein